jgi:hypothetical protein
LGKVTKRQIKLETGQSISKLYEIFVAMDELNASLSRLSEVLNETEFDWLETYFAKMPKYEELDDLDQFLTDLRSGIIKEEKNYEYQDEV